MIVEYHPRNLTGKRGFKKGRELMRVGLGSLWGVEPGTGRKIRIGFEMLGTHGFGDSIFFTEPFAEVYKLAAV